MDEIVKVEARRPSEHLMICIKETANSIRDSCSGWLEVLDGGKMEGFTEQELREMILPILKDKLEALGYNKRQIINKINYLFNADRIKENRNKRYLEQKSLNVQAKYSGTDQSSSFTDKTALDEIARLRAENNELHETIKNISFNDNPSVFAVNKETGNYFANVTLLDAATIIRSSDSNQQKKINLAWEVVQQ